MHLVKTILTAGLLLSAAAQAHNVLEFPQPENNPEEFYAVTEIPTGGIVKYETDAKTGFIVADRFQSMPVAYPANYGSLTQSLAGDGDPLDVVFYTRAPMAPGTLIKLRAIGVLKMIVRKTTKSSPYRPVKLTRPTTTSRPSPICRK